MAFIDRAYTSDNDETFRVRLQEDTAAAGGFTTPAPANVPFAKISKSGRGFGIRPRGVRGSYLDGNRKVYRFIPFATEAAYESALSSGSVTVGGQAYTNLKRVPEDI